jgi:transcriptional regulator with XRE-family HTH domain
MYDYTKSIHKIDIVMKLYKEIFNDVFRETMDQLGIKGSYLAERSGRSRNNITEIRKGKAFPAIGDFVELLILCEEEKPGFFEEFARQLIGQSRRLTVSPEEFVGSLDSSEFGALMYACAARVNKSEISKAA